MAKGKGGYNNYGRGPQGDPGRGDLMEIYQYQATDRTGKIITGTMEDSDERAIIDRLQEMGLFPMSVKRQAVEGSQLIKPVKLTIGRRIRQKEVMTFTQQLGALLDAGLPLDKSLRILSEVSEKDSMKEIIKDVLLNIQGGGSLSDSLAKHPKAFPPVYTNMVKAGETGGVLEPVISRLSDYLENSQRLREDIRSALIYPALLTFVGGGSVAFLLSFVVPRFTQIFKEMGQNLPVPTLLLLSLSNGMKQYWWLLLGLILIIFFGLRSYIKTEAGRSWWDASVLKLPLFGQLVQKVAISRFARTLGTLLNSGVPILQALSIVKDSIGNDVIARSTAIIREEVKRGKGIAKPLKDSGVFPPLSIHMMVVGEETGRLDEMLIKVADRYDSETRIAVKRMISLLEPAMILFMGLVVGFIVVAILLAIFSVNEMPF
jgi:general secretion pathway protein F